MGAPSYLSATRSLVGQDGMQVTDLGQRQALESYQRPMVTIQYYSLRAWTQIQKLVMARNLLEVFEFQERCRPSSLKSQIYEPPTYWMGFL